MPVKASQRLDRPELLRLHELMTLIRHVELRLGKLFADGEVPGFIHLSIGQEAVAAGVGAALSAQDTVASTHRGHGHALAKGLELEAFFLELMAREEGMCGGRGGSMHVADMTLGMLGANAIVGASIPIALGSALAHRTLQRSAVAVGFFGDGAMAEGVLHESMNMAALWNLPLLFVCENNGWAEFSPTSRQFNAPLSGLASAFGIPHQKLDGGDPEAVFVAARQAVEAMRPGGGPRVLEFTTHRFRGHYEGDPQKYRDAGELEGLDEHDPLPAFRRILGKRLRMKAAEFSDIDKQIAERVDAAVSRARNGRHPDFDRASQDVYTTGSRGVA